jgi:hypothetical protein
MVPAIIRSYNINKNIKFEVIINYIKNWKWKALENLSIFKIKFRDLLFN